MGVRGVAAILGFALLAAVAASLLPDNPYQRFQLLDGTIYQSLRWDYERIHFDPRPVDVAIVGPSTSVLGLSAGRLQQDLTAEGKPANVANFSIIADGRNVEWAIIDELYKTKKPKVIVVAVDQTPHPWGHPAFKYVATASAIAFPPSPLLHDFLYGVLFLPYRQIELFAARLFPVSLGLTDRFDPVRYALTPTDFTVSHRMEDGKWIDMDHEIPRAVLLADHRRHLAGRKRSIVPHALSDIVEADDHDYVREIAKLAAAHGTRVVFVLIPMFNGPSTVNGQAFYERYGPVLDNGDLADKDRLYQGWAHLNHAGATILTDRVARAVSPML
jgi:hypothetical protein